MRVELRRFGDGKTIVLYTDDNEVYRKLPDSTKCFKEVLYEQEDTKKLKIVGIDLYFDKKYKNWLTKTLGLQKLGNF